MRLVCDESGVLFAWGFFMGPLFTGLHVEGASWEGWVLGILVYF